MNGNSLLCPFLDGSEAFALGVEFGLLWPRLRGDEDAIEDYFLRANQEQILLACSRLGWRAAKMEPWDECWMWFRLEKAA